MWLRSGVDIVVGTSVNGTLKVVTKSQGYNIEPGSHLQKELFEEDMNLYSNDTTSLEEHLEKKAK